MQNKITAFLKSKRLKDILLKTICISITLGTVFSSFGYVSATSYYRTLGSQEALNSPILNSEFSSEDWNKWEMICWGVFCSNFTQPFIDTYESAFSSSSNKGSKGAGYAALVFGGASDSGSEETLQNLLNYAIGQQNSDWEKQIYVTYSTLSADNTITKNDPTQAVAQSAESGSTDTDGTSGGTDTSSITADSTVNIRPATVKDLFFAQSASDGDTYADYGSDNLGYFNSYKATIDLGEGTKPLVYCDDASLPTFWINGANGGYVKVFDYTDSWDPQVFAASIIKAASGDYSDELLKEIQAAFDNDYSLVLDCFGNICSKTSDGKKVIINAASNQHITSDNSINLLTSTIFNGYMQNITEAQLINYAEQSGSGNLFGIGAGKSGAIDASGFPAFGGSDSSISSGTVLCYYDLDTVIAQSKFGSTAASSGESVSYGKAVQELMDCDISQNIGGKYTLKIEALNSTAIAQDIDPSGEKSWFSKYSTMLHTINCVSMLANQLENGSSKSTILSSIKDVNGDEYSIFGDPVLVPVQSGLGTQITESGSNGATAFRFMIKHMYNVYKDGVSNTYGTVNADSLQSALSSDNAKDFIVNLTRNGKSNTDFSNSFVTSYSGSIYSLKGSSDQLKLSETTYYNTYEVPLEMKYNGKDVASIKSDWYSDTIATALKQVSPTIPGRMVLVYPVSEVMKAANNYLGLKDGAQYSAYASKIYMTYLDWYGVTGSGDDASSKFNTQIFDSSSDILKVDINDLVEAISQEEKEKEILNMTYLMLHPTQGREYRTTLTKNNLADFLYSQYQSTVYGESVSYTSGNLTTTKSAGGFLNIETLMDNFTTKAFMDVYVDIVAILIVVFIVLIIVIGLLRGRPISWFFISFIVAINALLITPSSGDITPYIANKVVQSIFRGNMTFWALSEAVENAEMESEYNDTSEASSGYMSGLTQEEKGQVINIVESLNSVNLDRSLVIKRDISGKINQQLSGNYAEIQNLRSARWLLPMIMRQYTANDSSTDYVSIPLGDMYDDLSNMYWYYKPMDAETADTLTSEQTGVSIDAATEQTLQTKSSFPGWVDTSIYSGSINYKSESYSLAASASDLEHTYMYIIADNRIHVPTLKEYVEANDGYEDLSSLDGYSQYCMNADPSIASTLKELVKDIESSASSYDRTDRGTVKQIFGYLWTTESPYHYLYGSIKDSFDTTFTLDESLTMAAIIGKIQGNYVINEDGEEVRQNFMYADDTGYIKDVLDLEDLFKNCIPYMYQMQLLAGGDDGKGGALKDVKISDTYSLYEGTDAAWLFRSNWVTKIIENPDYSNAETVKDSSGNKYTVANPALYFTYPSEREMVFSEAQMHSMGLKESDLTVLELKCIEINKNVARRWTMLLNYANTDGMTKEVLLRQMTTEAVLEFNSQLSPSGVLSGSYALYPNSLDLRALSFDSVIRMLLLNVTRNTGYMYSDTMLNVISNLDLISAVLLWVAAELCSWVIPLCRQILMGAIFYLGLLSTVWTVFASNSDKIRKACAQIIVNVGFLVVTIIYYMFFKLLMGLVSTDEVLSVSSVQVNVGNPVWCFVLIIVASVIYIFIMVRIFRFCFINFRDMGFEVLSGMANLATEKIQGAVSGLAGGLQSIFSGESRPSGRSGDSAGGSGVVDNNNSGGSSKVEVIKADQMQVMDEASDAQAKEDMEDYRANSFADTDNDTSDSSRYDREVEKGRNIED